jgi:PAS domain S-box-containing protein
MGLETEQESVGKTDFNVFPPEIAEWFYADDQRVLSTGEPVLDREEFLIRKGEPGKWLLTSKLPLLGEGGQIVGLVGIGRDITDRKRIHEELRKRNEFIETVLEHLPVGVLVYTLPDGASQVMTQRFADIHGWPKDPLMRLDVFFERVFPDPEFRRQVEERISKEPVGDAPPRLEWENLSIVTQEGERKTVTIRAHRLPDQGLIIFIAEDVTERVRTEEALQESEERYRHLVDILPDGILVHAGEQIVFANATALAMVGADRPDQVLGKSVMEFVHPDNQLIVDERIRRMVAFRSKVPQIEEKFLRLDGTPFDVEVAAVGFRYQKKTAVLTLFRDITERRKAERALLDSERRFQMLLEHAPDGINIFEVDLARDTRRLVFCNDRYVEMSGYTRVGLLAHSDEIDELIVYHPAAEEHPATPAELYRSGKVHRGTCSWKRPDRKENYFEYIAVPMDIDGRPHFIGIDRDITERIRTEEALKFTQFAIEHSADAAFWMGPDARLVYVNEAACTSLGYSRRELLGMTVHDIDPDFPPDGWRDHWREVQARRSFIFESRHRANDGRVFPVEIQANYVSFGGKEYNCSFSRDISQRKAMEERIKAEIREKEVLLREIHHRVKNNLQVISSLLNLQASLVRDEASRHLFNESRSRIRSMALVHEQLYRSESLARIGFGHYIDQLAAELLLSFGPAGRRVRLVKTIPPASIDINTAIPLGLIVNELLTNALKHAFPGIGTSRGGNAANRIAIHLKSLPEGDWMLAVKDNGKGLPRDFNVHRSDSLGMKIVVALVEQLGGILAVKGEDGTEVSIRFPGEGITVPGP